MSKAVKYLILVAVFVLVLIGCVIGYNNLVEKYDPESVPTPVETPETGSVEEDVAFAPDFTVYDMEGEAVKLSDFRGKPVLVNFWATWCGPCKMEMPSFEALYAEYGDRVEFMMVNLTDGSQETRTTVRKYLAETGYSFPVYLDTTTQAAYAYGVYSIPMSVFVDANGEIIHTQIGMMSEDSLRSLVEAMIGG